MTIEGVSDINFNSGTALGPSLTTSAIATTRVARASGPRWRNSVNDEDHVEGEFVGQLQKRVHKSVVRHRDPGAG